MISVGPVFAIPRTAATTHEVGILPFFPGAPIWLTSAIFFAVTFALAIRETGVIDIIGKYITPFLLVFLGTIIVKATIHPIGPVLPTENADFFTQGIKEGYQTMDAMVALLCTSIVTGDLIRKGYGSASKQEKQMMMIIKVCVLAMVLLFVIYGGLAYVGAQGGTHFAKDATRVEILVGSVGMLLGRWGQVALAVAVSLACLTTAVGLTSAAGNFFNSVSNDKWRYEYVVVSVFISFTFSLVGVDGIIGLAGPVLDIVYPAIIAMSFIMIFDRQIKYDGTIIGMAVGTIIAAALTTIYNATGSFEGAAKIIENMPLAEFGFSWLVPGLVGAFVGTICGVMDMGKTRDDHDIKPAF